MIKILQFAPGFLSGGIESRMLDWYRNINREEIQFILVKLNEIDDTPNITEFVELGGKFYDLPPFGIKSSIRFEKQIIRIIKDEKIDLVHVHDPNTGFFALKAAKKCGIKCRIFHSRTTAFLPNEKNVFIKKIIMKQTPKYATDYFACSYEAGKWGCGKVHKDEVVVVKNGIQDELFVFDNSKREKIRKKLNIDQKKVIGTIGRLSPQKNLPFLLDIMSELIKKDKDYVLLLVGDGDKSIIESYYKEYKNLSSNIIMVGAKKNVWDYYMAMDVFCGTSLYEGFGTTAIESQASGLPTLVSTGFPEVVEITKFIKRLDTKDVHKWIKEIEASIGKRYSEEGINEVINNGYSARMVAKKLEEFYIKHARR